MKIPSAIALRSLVLLCLMGFIPLNAQPIDTTQFSQKYVHLKSLFERLPSRGGEIVFLGNSITEQGAWSELLDNPRIVNRGIGGDTSDGVLYRIAEVADSRPLKVFLMIGTNDLKFNKTPAYILGRIGQIVDSLRQDSPLTEIYLQSVLPTLDRPERPIPAIREINEGLKTMADGKQVRYIDLFTAFADPQRGEQLYAKFTRDGLHLNGEGYLLWKSIVAPYAVDPVEARWARNRERMKNPDSPYVFVVAHRGDWRSAPENSLGSLEGAIALGVDIVETDVNMTKDGQLVVIHDLTLDRTTTAKGRLSNYTLAQLHEVRLKDGLGHQTDYGIPTLEDYLKLAKGRVILDLDVKADIPFEKIGSLLVKYDMLDQVILRSYRTHKEARAYYGNFFASIWYFPGLNGKMNDGLTRIRDFETNSNPGVYVPSFEAFDPGMEAMFTEIRANGDRIWVHSISDSRSGGHGDEKALSDPHGNYGWLIEQGVRFIQTDRPAALLAYLRHHNLHD